MGEVGDRAGVGDCDGLILCVSLSHGEPSNLVKHSRCVCEGVFGGH